MAFILVQHLDPNHQSMMVNLLATRTSLTVSEATDGMPLERNHLYVIPPGDYLSIADGALRLSEPREPHGARLPFDYLLHSMAIECGARAICVILSGSGADGSVGLRSVKEKSGLVIAQDPDEASSTGMPRSAIMTGAVDFVLPVAEIPKALVKFNRRMLLARTQNGLYSEETPQSWLPEIIELLRAKTGHDFSLYKQGTLQRRIERRMAMAVVEVDNMDRYLEILRNDDDELELVAKDLLINVTNFFRDPSVFDYLNEKIIPNLIKDHATDRPLRIWIAGCSTGEEAYSLTMLFREQISASNRNVKLQVFASDVDAEAIATAREGRYPKTIEADVSLARLARFFSKEEQGYKVMPELRASVVFTVQDVLADPPFSRLDLVSCRNLMSYLRPEAQTKAIGHFHFALGQGGILLLGSSETIGESDDRFEVIAKHERIYRHIGRSRPGELTFSLGVGTGMRVPAVTLGKAASPQNALADMCRRLVMETYAPAAVLINHKHQCLFSLGPTTRYLNVATGHPTQDLLAMAHSDMRAKLKSAIQQAGKEKARIVVPGGRTKHNGKMISFSIAIQPVHSGDETHLLICFIDEPSQETGKSAAVARKDGPRVAELEQDLEAARSELQGVIRNLEISSEEHRAINEEALSVSEEYQSTNEELLTSKEELQSLNEELTALNAQLQETLERQRTTSNDLQNVLYSTDVATIFLDSALHIRFFTPATKLLFNVIPGDIGRPLADLSSLSVDGALQADARTVLRNFTPIERDIEARSGAWYNRRTSPYRADDGAVEGVVITFTDITERRRARNALEATKRKAQLANVAKSRFLASASHDLRQPLQTLVLLQGLLARSVEGEKAQRLVERFDDTLSAMSSMLNALLDINQIEAGTVRPELATFPIDDLLRRMRDEFALHAEEQKIDLRVVFCGLSIKSDPRLLEQMVRNIISNALKYTKRGKVLLGCRRRAGLLCVEIWDTGVGIPDDQLEAIFEEYHQLDNAARERSLGLGLGLSIVRRLGQLLGHRVGVVSRPGKGSVFSIEIKRLPNAAGALPKATGQATEDAMAAPVRRAGTILLVDDDPDVREFLELLLQDEGYRVAVAGDGVAALAMAVRGSVKPDLILADYNLPHGMDGLQLAAKLQETLRRDVPVVILTGDISTETLRNIASCNYVQLNKPVKPAEMIQTIERLLGGARSAAAAAAPIVDQKKKPTSVVPPAQATSLPVVASGSTAPTIFLVDDDNALRAALRDLLEQDGKLVEDYSSCEAFLEAFRPGLEACLLIDAYLPGMNGLELLERLRADGQTLPAIMITGDSDVPMAVKAMKAGASDFIEKPVGPDDLLASVERALERSRDATKLSDWHEEAAKHMAALTSREREIMELVLAGHPSKNIAADLGISQRTVENHRASIMKKTRSKSLPALARLALAAAGNGNPRAAANP